MNTRLPHIGVLRFAGLDAISFLQGQVSNDTGRLAEGKPILAAYSTAQGRVLAVLHLIPHSSGILALLPREIAAPTLERLRKFVLRAKVNIEDLSDRLAVIGAHGAAAVSAAGFAIPDAAGGYLEQDGIAIARVGSAAHSLASRYWVIRPATPAERPPDPHVEIDWRLSDIRAGLPQVYAATSESFVAQMLNLDLIDGISFSKGCYTGQEIIARTQHLGRIKRRMFRLRLPPGSWSVGQSLKLADGRAGRLAEVASAGAEIEALAVLNLEAGAAEADGAPGESVAAVELPLPYVKDQASGRM